MVVDGMLETARKMMNTNVYLILAQRSADEKELRCNFTHSIHQSCKENKVSTVLPKDT